MDLLATPQALSEWLVLAGVSKTPICLSPGEHHEALLLREAIHDLACSVVLDATPLTADIELINKHAATPNAAPQLSTTGIFWMASRALTACLSDIARDAVLVMGGAETARLRMCNEDGCRMLFFDASPANRRRWCSMSICGNRDKVAMHRQKKQREQAF